MACAESRITRARRNPTTDPEDRRRSVTAAVSSPNGVLRYRQTLLNVRTGACRNATPTPYQPGQHTTPSPPGVT